MNGAKVVDAADLIQTKGCYFAIFYVFNIVFPEEIKMSAAFF